MYSSKHLCFKNSKDFLALNDPYVRVKVVDPRYKGKQFLTAPLKMGQTEGLFKKLEYSTDVYQDNSKYISTQPRDGRKLGFGSYDAKRRDEFSSDIRAKQWKEKLKTENIYAQTALKNAGIDKNTAQLSEAQQLLKRQADYTQKYAHNDELFQTKVPWNLYDIGREEAFTPICNKCPRERFYCPHRVGRGAVTLRRPGTAPTSSKAYGDFVTQAEKPKFGMISEHKSFYDNSHLTTQWGV